MNNKESNLSRRQMLASTVALGSCGLHAPYQHLHAKESPVKRPASHGIAELRLQSAKIDLLQHFYGHDLGLPTKRNGGELTIIAGSTRIIFESVDSDRSDPFYHVAFNIPENKLKHALQWQKQRTELVRRGTSEVIHFAKWNADSIFFRDPAGNLLEYIARHNLNNASEGDFSTTDILYASEIGLVVDDVPGTVAAAKKHLHMDIYRDNSANFASIGDEHALLIVVKRGRKWFPAKTNPANVYPTVATIRHPQPNTLMMQKFGYSISTR